LNIAAFFETMTAVVPTQTNFPKGTYMDEQTLNGLLSDETLCSQPSVIRELTALADKPEVLSLAGGWPAPEDFPVAEITDIFNHLVVDHGAQMLQYGPTHGFLELREEIAVRMQKEGLEGVGADEILITHGSTQGMNLCAQIFVNRGDMMIVEIPTYIGGISSIQLRGGKMQGVSLDSDGLNTEHLAGLLAELKQKGNPVKGLYLVPNFQNPTGVTLSAERRRHLMEIAETYNLVIFEDDPYCELRFEGEVLPSLKQLDPDGRVVHLRSFSKTFNPGMRLGWIVADRRIIRHMITAKQSLDISTNSFSQLIVLEFIQRGLLEKQIKKNIEHYRAKRDFMLTQLEKYFPQETRWNRPLGGFFIFVHLPEKLKAADLFYAAIDRNIAFINAHSFFVDGSGHNTIRLSYSQASFEVIEIVIREIAALIREHLAKI
jgi:2-aminoadipate transaminase